MKRKRAGAHRRTVHRHPGRVQEAIPVADEVLTVGKRTVQTGITRVVKRVHEREEEIDQPLLAQRVEVERVPVNRFVEAAVPVRQQDGTTIIPVLEEVLLVEIRLLLKEELHVRTISETIHDPQKVMLRREEVEVEHVDLPEQPGRQHH